MDGHFSQDALQVYAIKSISLWTISCLSIDKITLYLKIRHVIASMWVTLGEGGGNEPPPSHAWRSSLLVDMFQGGLEEQITEAVVLTSGEAVLFSGWWLCKEWLPLGSTRDIGLSLTGPISWAGRAVQVEATQSTVWEGCWAIEEKEQRQGIPMEWWR